MYVVFHIKLFVIVCCIFSFSISPTTGELSTNAVLDREVESEYMLVVTATDSGDPPLYDQTNIRIIVDDVNDNTPVFTVDKYSGSIREDASVGSTVVQVF